MHHARIAKEITPSLLSFLAPTAGKHTRTSQQNTSAATLAMTQSTPPTHLPSLHQSPQKTHQSKPKPQNPQSDHQTLKRPITTLQSMKTKEVKMQGQKWKATNLDHELSTWRIG
jgi:hypothetical protein